LQGSQILAAAEALYISKSKSTHDDRFVEALREVLELREIYLDKPNSNQAELIAGEQDLIIASPLSTGINSIPQSSNATIIGICMAYEINEEAKEKNRFDEIYENIKRCSAIVCDCDYIENELRSRFAFAGEILKIAYGCDQEIFQSVPFENQQELRIISTRNWTPIHSNTTSIEALRALQDGTLKFEAKFYGVGIGLTQELRESVSSEFSDKIQFLGRFIQEDLPSAFSKSEIYLSASISDGTSVSLLEAMASGRLCICRDFPSNREWITNGINGFLFTTPSELAEILISISQLSFEEKSLISNAARESVLTRGNWEIMRTNLINFTKHWIKQ
jgi:glycosyltransferase involved in cell wall biosynthesis